MLERFVKDARDVAAAASEEARVQGSPTVEAEHLLLALSGSGDGPARAALETHGLDREALLDALELAFARALEVVGVSPAALGSPPPVPAAGRQRWGASAKGALEGALRHARERGDRRIEPAHILLSLLDAREGTVPRLLRAAGTDPQALATATAAALDAAALKHS